MKKKTKKILSLLLAVILMFGALPIVNVSAKTVDSGKCGDNITWTLDSSGTVTVSGKGKMYEYSQRSPWSSNYNIKKVVIKDGITSIGSYAFYDCMLLESVKFPSTLKEIGDEAFEECSYLKEVKLPNGLKTIGKNAFTLCFNLKKLTLPDTLETIKYQSFAGCAFENLTIPSSLKRIGDESFKGCASLKNLKINNGVKEIGDFAFGGCSALKTVKIPNSVTTIDDFAFYSCESLKNVEFGNKIKEIGYCAFADCPKLKSVSLPKSINYLDDGSFGINIVYKMKDGMPQYIEKIEKVKGFKIYGFSDTVAKDYAENFDLKFVDLSKPKNVKLSFNTCTYTGKVRKPSVTVKDAAGKTLKQGTDYTVKYSKGRKDVGTYTVTVTFKGNYSGTKKLTFKILPNGTSISKLTAGKKRFTANWKKQSTQTNGYEIQYSTSSNMKNAKIVTITKNSTTSKTVKDLKASKMYYVRIRTYKTVNGNKLYSSWSSTKQVKTK